MHRDVVQQVGMVVDQFQVALFGRKGGQFSGAVFVIGKRLLKHPDAEILERRTLPDQRIQTVFGDRQQSAFGNARQIFVGRRLVVEMNIRGDETRRTIDVGGYLVTFVVGMKQPHKARIYEVKAFRNLALFFDDAMFGKPYRLKVLPAQCHIVVCQCCPGGDEV